MSEYTAERNLNYAVAEAYQNNSNRYECIKYVRKNYNQYSSVDDEVIEEIWNAIDAYVDIAT
jgi:hypothetical protein